MQGVESTEQGPVYTYLDGEGNMDGYREAVDLDRLKARLQDELQDYNDVPKNLGMNLVLFRDAVRHIARIHRVLATPRGNAMLIGVGGSGRQSLTRLAAHITQVHNGKPMDVFQIEITKHYGEREFHDDLKALYEKAGQEGLPTVFLFSDTQLKEESFLEDINNILSSGEVPNLFDKDERSAIFDSMRAKLKQYPSYEDTAEDLWSLFVARVRDNLHVVLAMSPVGDGFRDRTRMYPSLVACTTMDWFHEWPKEALEEVAASFLADTQILEIAEEGESKEEDAGQRKGARAPPAVAAGSSGEEAEDPEAGLKREIAALFAVAHRSVARASDRMMLELRRKNYVTPSNYLELVKVYSKLLDEKRYEVGSMRDKLAGGLEKLDHSRAQVEVKKAELEVASKEVEVKSAEVEELMVEIATKTRQAKAREEDVNKDAERIAEEEKVCRAIAEDAERDLNEAMPMLEEALAQVDKLDKSAVTEVKGYTQPPELVQLTLKPVMILFNRPTDWASCKSKLSESDFLVQVKKYDKENVSEKMLNKL